MPPRLDRAGRAMSARKLGSLKIIASDGLRGMDVDLEALVEKKAAMDSPTFERSGEPTEETLKAIAEWPAHDPAGWLDFCAAAWNATYGRSNGDGHGGLELITGGWSDNESIIGTMQKNWMLWSRCWLSSHRGGKYVFEEAARG